MDKKQLIQEQEYSFPYHYIPARKPNLSYYRYWGGWWKYLLIQDFLDKQIREIRHQDIVDIGCGEGAMTNSLAEIFTNKKFVGIDYSDHVVKLATLFSNNARFKRINIINEQTNVKFDLAFSIEVLEHIPPQEVSKFVNGVRRLLRKDGMLILTVPHKNLTLIDKHYQHFDKSSLIGELENDFHIEQLLHINSRPKGWTRFILKICINKLYLLTYQPLINYLFKLLSKNCFLADENDAAGILVKCKPKI